MGLNASAERVEAVFAVAVAKASEAERAAYLEGACGDDVALRERVEALLASHEAAEGFLSRPPLADAASTVADNPAIAEGPGTRIGRYKLLQVIGEGGFGSVFMAEQEHPVRRKVALKIIKLGMDTRQVIARFEAERQALAMMDHPHIAKVLDAGATDSGRPFFVMELVRGVPITEYCDTNNLSTRDRLELFVPVCHAVQHAHQKGIIHRDIKPSNILVTMADGRPIPKVIDFGIAKATSARLTEKTLFTEFRQLIGTPEYMSPEQAEMSGIDVDTRTDVYSLGVLLYELLTGTTPFDPKELRSKAYGEIQRMIREVEPPRPSTRVSSLGPTLAAVAAHRRTEPRKLGQLMRGELDWIVMKAMEKDRTRRYETANGLAMDVKRYLEDEPVSARPAGAGYRLRKFATKHKVGFAAAGGVAAALVLGLALATAGFVRARTERDRAVTLAAALDEQRRDAIDARARAETAKADAEKDRAAAKASEEDARVNLGMMLSVVGFINDMFSAADPDLHDPDVTVRQMLDRTVTQLDERGTSYPPRVEAAIRHTMGQAYNGLGRLDDAEVQYRKTISLREAALPADHPALTQAVASLGSHLANQRRFDEAVPLLERAMDVYRRSNIGGEHLIGVLDSLQFAADALGDHASAERFHREAVELRQKSGVDPSVVQLFNLAGEASVHLGRKDYAAAERNLRQAIDLNRRVTQGKDDRQLIALYHNLGLALAQQGRHDEAVAAYGQSLEASEKLLGRDHVGADATVGNLAAALRAQGKEDDARAYESRRVSIRIKGLDEAIRQRPSEGGLHYERGVWKCRAGRFKDALPDFDKALELDPADHEKYFFAAPAYLHAGDVDGYRRLSRELTRRFRSSDRPEVGERIAKASLIEPDPEADLAVCAQLLERAVSAGPSHPYADWFRTTQGLFEYRRGDYAKALSVLEGLPEKGNMHDYGRGLAGLVRAMALARSGKADEARKTLAEVTGRFDALRTTPGTGDLGSDYSNWFTYQIVLRQARAVVEAADRATGE